MNLRPSPVDFHESNHTYTLNVGNPGKLVPGVTTVCQPVGFPSDIASAWAAKECVGFLDAQIGSRKSVSASTLRKWLPVAKGAYKRKSTAAAGHGTEAHDWIEQWVKLGLEGKPQALDIPKTDEAGSATIAFLEWEAKYKPQWLASELVVGSLVHEFGGKLDAIALLDGKLTLVDFKTSNHISDSYYIQTAGYALALEEMDCNIEQRLILRIDKQGKGFEARVVPTPLDLDIETFIALRQVARWTSYVKN